MPEELQKLIEAAKTAKVSDIDREQQRRSFAYGNTAIENPRITRQIVDREAEALHHEK